MDYAIWLQILMELALAVSGEHEINALLKKASRAFHRKLDCTHITILEKNDVNHVTLFVSPNWVKEDKIFNKLAVDLNTSLGHENLRHISQEQDGVYYYGFKLESYGSLIIARGQEMPYKLIKELEPIVDMFSTNIQACFSFARQVQIEQEIRAQKAYTEHFAYHDSLTNLPNRRKFMEGFEHALTNNKTGAMLLLDLDNFKTINDTLGHGFGDQVLIYIAEELKQIEDESMFISRFGGDEFQILIIDKNKVEVEGIINKIFVKLSKIHKISGHKVDVSFSMGISLFPEDSNNVSRLLMNADLAMYSIKNSEKNNYRFFDLDLSKNMERKQIVEDTLKNAINQNGFEVVYQPKVECIEGEIIGFEALLRLKDSDISPGEFIPIAEENKCIIKIGRIVTALVIEQLADWKKSRVNLKPISINFSAAQIYDLTYFDYLINMLNLYSISPEFIEIEITENVFIDNRERTLELLREFRKVGIKISIDDFGTGYSSLSYLTFLPINILKLDKSIIEKFLELESLEVMSSLIALAHSLGLEVVAEGVETREQVKQLSDIRCDYIQGFYFSKPIKAEEVVKIYSHSYKNLI